MSLEQAFYQASEEECCEHNHGFVSLHGLLGSKVV